VGLRGKGSCDDFRARGREEPVLVLHRSPTFQKRLGGKKKDNVFDCSVQKKRGEDGVVCLEGDVDDGSDLLLKREGMEKKKGHVSWLLIISRCGWGEKKDHSPLQDRLNGAGGKE